jgi:hypothetical protein
MVPVEGIENSISSPELLKQLTNFRQDIFVCTIALYLRLWGRTSGIHAS